MKEDMKEGIKNNLPKILALFKEPWTQLSALLVICATVVILSGCSMSATGVTVGDNTIDDISIEIKEFGDE